MLNRDRRELAAWTIRQGETSNIIAGPFRLVAGFQILAIETDGEDRPTGHADVFDEARTPYSFRLESVEVGPAADQ